MVAKREDTEKRDEHPAWPTEKLDPAAQACKSALAFANIGQRSPMLKRRPHSPVKYTIPVYCIVDAQPVSRHGYVVAVHLCQ